METLVEFIQTWASCLIVISQAWRLTRRLTIIVPAWNCGKSDISTQHRLIHDGDNSKIAICIEAGESGNKFKSDVSSSSSISHCSVYNFIYVMTQGTLYSCGRRKSQYLAWPHRLLKGLITVGRELRKQHPSDLLSGAGTQNTSKITTKSSDVAYLPTSWCHASLLNDGSCSFTHPVVKDWSARGTSSGM